jgi:hypothetical protein
VQPRLVGLSRAQKRVRGRPLLTVGGGRAAAFLRTLNVIDPLTPSGVAGGGRSGASDSGPGIDGVDVATCGGDPPSEYGRRVPLPRPPK